MKSILFRDLYLIFNKFSFWLIYAAWFFICGLLFFAYIDDFVHIQAELISKNIDTNLMRLVITPYLRVISNVGFFVTVCFCSSVFRYECHSTFTLLYRSLGINNQNLLLSKMLYLLIITLCLILPIILPIIALSFYADINVSYLIICLLAFLAFLFEIGMLTLCISNRYASSAITIFITTSVVIVIEIIVKLVPEPIWINKIIAYLSPISHFNHILLGELALSDGIYFITVVGLSSLILIRMLDNSKLPS